MAAQARMRSAKVLLINLGALGTEVAKNVVLSGIGSLTILDEHEIVDEDLRTQFFISKEEVGQKRLEAAKPRIQDMNPRVDLRTDVDNFKRKSESYFEEFDLIIGTDLSREEIRTINAISRKYNIPLYIAGLHGIFGYIFVDLIEFNAIEEKEKSSVATSLGVISQNREVVEVTDYVDDEKSKAFEKVITKHIYQPFEISLKQATLNGKLTRRQLKRLTNAVPLILALFDYDSDFSKLNTHNLKESAVAVCKQLGLSEDNLRPDYIEMFVEQAGVQFAPVSAVIGGALAQDVINILGKRQSPLNNFVVLDGLTLDMQIFEL